MRYTLKLTHCAYSNRYAQASFRLNISSGAVALPRFAVPAESGNNLQERSALTALSSNGSAIPHYGVRKCAAGRRPPLGGRMLPVGTIRSRWAGANHEPLPLFNTGTRHVP